MNQSHQKPKKQKISILWDALSTNKTWTPRFVTNKKRTRRDLSKRVQIKIKTLNQKNKKKGKGWMKRKKGRVPRGRGACSDHTRERRNQPRCDRMKKWRNRSWTRPAPAPSHPPRIAGRCKSGSKTEQQTKAKASTSSSSCVVLDPNTKQFDTILCFSSLPCDFSALFVGCLLLIFSPCFWTTFIFQ